MRPKFFAGSEIQIERPATPTMEAVMTLVHQTEWELIRHGRLRSGEPFTLHKAIDGPGAVRLKQLLDDPVWTRCLRGCGIDRGVGGEPVRTILG